MTFYEFINFGNVKKIIDYIWSSRHRGRFRGNDYK